jgi:hypothetical protein
MYGSEAWTLTQTDEATSCTFGRKISSKIYGPVQDKGDLANEIKSGTVSASPVA